MLKKYGDLISGSFLLILSVAMFIASFYVKRLTISSIGSGFVPQVVAVLLAIVSIAIIRHGIIAVRNNPKAEKKKSAIKKDSKEEKLNVTGVLITLVLIVIYIATLASVGFLITTAMYLFLQITALATKEQRKIPLFIIISILTSTSVYFIFIKVFHLMLPSGILG
jgi:putative tricarboxylic transport membrane protein